MKLYTLITALLLPVLLFGVRVPVTYSQIFADRVITLTEDMTLFGKHTLEEKKGFMCYGRLL